MLARNQAGQSNVHPRQSWLPRWLQIVVIGRNPKVTLVRVAVLIVTCFVVFRFILLPARIEGISMLPTYKDRSVNFVNRLAYRWHEPRRGDVVGIRLAGPKKTLSSAAFAASLKSGSLKPSPICQTGSDW